MLSFQWNSLRVGDRVSVHDDRGPGLALSEGVVTIVEPRPRRVNEVGIQVGDHPSELVRPRRHAVHLLPIDDRFPCWRCDTIAASAAGASLDQGVP